MVFLGRSFFFSLFALMGAMAASPIQAVELYKEKIKAGLVYNFLKYTEWLDAQAGAPLTVCLYGGDPFGGQLQPMRGRTVNQRPIVLRDVESASDVDGCDALLINARAASRWPELSRAIAGKGILTVSDWEGFSAAGGMVEFVQVDAKIQARLNMNALSAANLRVGQRMLNLLQSGRSGE